MTQAAAPYITLEDFVAEEVERDEKHEWLDGVVYAMSRGSYEHARLAMRIGSALTVALNGRCSVSSSDVMLYVPETKLATYADVTVVCGAPELERVERKGRVVGEALLNPTVLVEVLSPKTETYDRTEKFSHYMRIPSLHEYVLMSSQKQRIEVHRRPKNRGHWAIEIAKPGESVTIHGESFRVDDLYAL